MMRRMIVIGIEEKDGGIEGKKSKPKSQ